MTDEDFLARWSRRKREVAKAEAEPKAEDKNAGAAPKPESIEKPEAEFDPASLPPIESINALTDITAFLRAGVPAELTRAALRRVWTADPAIRDFVGLAENAWDFTDPTAMPGFGPLESTEEVRRMIAAVVDQIGHAAEQPPASKGTETESASESDALEKESAVTASAAQPEASEKSADYSEHQVLVQGSKVDTAPQQDVRERPPENGQASRRSHGGALPS